MQNLIIRKYLVDSVLKADHPRAIRLKTQLEQMAQDKGAEIKSFDITKPGEALFSCTDTNAADYIMQEFKSLQGVEVQMVSPLALDYELNRTKQEALDKQRDKKNKS
jgi:hypothetical protein